MSEGKDLSGSISYCCEELSAMEDALFHSLNAGARFNKKRFGQQIDLFKHGNKHQGGAAQQLGFAYAAGGLDGAPADTLDFFNNDKGLEKSNRTNYPRKRNRLVRRKVHA